jgi:hypothetical protein
LCFVQYIEITAQLPLFLTKNTMVIEAPQ